MPAPALTGYWSEYLWIVVCGALASLFMAWGIGANDVANAFATSVGSKTLKLWQAMVIAGVFEFTGAVALGAEVTKTIAADISNVAMFQDTPEFYMYGMLTALTTAGVWLWVATFCRLPVSTTHSIIGAIMGFSLVFGGVNGVLWNSKRGDFPYTKGFLPVVLSWFFSPLIGGILGAIIFSLNRICILRRQASTMLAIYSLPVLLFFTFFINIMFVLAKGAQKEMQKTWPCDPNAIGKWGLKYTDCSDLYAASAWIAACVAIGIAIFGGAIGIYFLRRRFLAQGSGGQEPDIEQVKSDAKLQVDLVPTSSTTGADFKIPEDGGKHNPDGEDVAQPAPVKDKDWVQPGLEYPTIPDIKATSLKNIGILALAIIVWPFKALWVQCKRGVLFDIFAHVHLSGSTANRLHENAEVFNPHTEKVYEVLQVFSACCVSFAHGSNDIANAAGPFSAIYWTYRNYTVPGSNVATPEWIFVMIALGLVVGLIMYGYNIILELGVNMLKLTPSRGFSAELAAGLTIVLASFFGIPVSTTQIIVGCEVGVGLCEGSAGISWYTFIRTFIGWIFTILLALSCCACLFSMGAYPPSIPMLNDIRTYRSQIYSLQLQLQNSLNKSNIAYRTDPYWSSNMANTGLPANGSAVLSTINANSKAYLSNTKYKSGSFATYVTPEQVIWYFNQTLQLSNQYKVAVPGQNVTALTATGNGVWNPVPAPAAAIGK